MNKALSVLIYFSLTILGFLSIGDLESHVITLKNQPLIEMKWL
jgi:hypothetical protein